MPLPSDVVDLMTGNLASKYPGGRSTVYRFFDSTGSLLYVGVTDMPVVRIAAHRIKALWWNRVDPNRTTLTEYDDRRTAELAELDAIKTENPEFNLTGKASYRPGRRRMTLPPEVAEHVQGVVGLFRQRQDIEAQYKAALAALTSPEGDAVPIAYIAEQLGVERKTVYRHLGRSMT